MTTRPLLTLTILTVVCSTNAATLSPPPTPPLPTPQSLLKELQRQGQQNLPLCQLPTPKRGEYIGKTIELFSKVDTLATKLVRGENITKTEATSLTDDFRPATTLLNCTVSALITEVSNLKMSGPVLTADLKLNIDWSPWRNSEAPAILKQLSDLSLTPKAVFRWENGTWNLQSVTLK